MDALADHQVRMLRGALPGSHAAKLRSVILRLPDLCSRGHRLFGMGVCYSMRELGPGVYDYVIGDCDDVERLSK